jgi:NitT/TauT family transport system substrate-binding protein
MTRTTQYVRMALLGFFVLTAIATTRTALANESVNFRLSFRLSGPHMPYFWALEKGYYKQQGLDVEIKEGAGAQQTINLIASKQDDLASADLMVLANAVSKGVAAKAVMAYVKRNAWGVIVYQESGIRKPADLAGKTIAVIADHKPLLELLLRTNSVPVESVTARVVNVAVRNTVFADGKVDGFVAQILGSPVDFVARANRGEGKPVHFMLFADFGIQAMSEGIIGHRDYLAQKPEVVRKFLRATVRAIDDLKNPTTLDEMVDIAMRRTSIPAERRESLKLQWTELLNYLAAPGTPQLPFGAMTEDEWRDTIEVLRRTGQIDHVPSGSDLYTNEFLP